jgi:hypothetical protein
MIDQLGGLDGLANEVNPIGGRPWLASDPTLGSIISDNLINWTNVLGADVAIDLSSSATPAQGSANLNATAVQGSDNGVINGGNVFPNNSTSTQGPAAFAK